MEAFDLHLNYRYPNPSDASSLHVSLPSRGSSFPPGTSTPNTQPAHGQTHPADVCAHSDPGRAAHTPSSLVFTAGHDPRLQQRNTPVVPRGVVHPDPELPMKICYLDQSGNLVDQYVPSSSDKITCTNHRPLDEIFGGFRAPSGLPQGMTGSPHPPQNERPYGHPRQTAVITYALPPKPQLDGVLQVPLLAVDNRMSGTGLIVDFRCSDWGIGVEIEGIPMSDLLHGNVSGLESPHQRVLEGSGITNLRLNILWPHYPPFAKVISGFGTDGKPMTRAELGYEVSLAFAEFFYQITSRSIAPAQSGPFAISLSSSQGLSSPGIKFEHLHLITVRNTSRGEWTSEIRAVLDP